MLVVREYDVRVPKVVSVEEADDEAGEEMDELAGEVVAEELTDEEADVVDVELA